MKQHNFKNKKEPLVLQIPYWVLLIIGLLFSIPFFMGCTGYRYHPKFEHTHQIGIDSGHPESHITRREFEKAFIDFATSLRDEFNRKHKKIQDKETSYEIEWEK